MFISQHIRGLNDLIPNTPLKDSDCRSGNLILQILWSCVHDEEKHRLNRLFSGNLLFNQNKTMQFSGLPLLPLVREGYSTVRTIADRFSGSLRHSSNIFVLIDHPYHNPFKDHRATWKFSRAPGNGEEDKIGK